MPNKPTVLGEELTLAEAVVNHAYGRMSAKVIAAKLGNPSKEERRKIWEQGVSSKATPLWKQVEAECKKRWGKEKYNSNRAYKWRMAWKKCENEFLKGLWTERVPPPSRVKAKQRSKEAIIEIVLRGDEPEETYQFAIESVISVMIRRGLPWHNLVMDALNNAKKRVDGKT